MRGLVAARATALVLLVSAAFSEAATKCETCLGKFDAAGGCKAMLSNQDPAKFIPQGCAMEGTDSCGSQAAAYCKDKYTLKQRGDSIVYNTTKDASGKTVKKVVCFDNTDYHGHEIRHVSNVASAGACQLLCRKQKGCNYFTYISAVPNGQKNAKAKACSLKTKKDSRKAPSGYSLTSGPRECLKDVTCQLWSFAPGVTGGDKSPCARKTALKAHWCKDGTCSNVCGLKCESGYKASGSGILTCDVTGQLNGGIKCTETTCAAYTLPTGVLSGDKDACKTGTKLKSGSDKTCQIKCAPGYNVAWQSSGAPYTVACDVSGKLTPSVQCKEATCSPFKFAQGVAAGAKGGCDDGVTLKSGSAKTCTLQCKSGYVGKATTLSCGTNGVLTGVISCKEATCPAYNFKDNDGVMSGNPPGYYADGCTDGIKLKSGVDSDNSCTVKCMPGYSSSAGTVNGKEAGSTLKCGTDGKLSGLLRCTESKCLAYSDLSSVTGGDKDGCKSKLVLTTGSNKDTSCSLKCAPGYKGDSGGTRHDPKVHDVGTLRCVQQKSADGAIKGVLQGMLTCKDVACNAYKFPPSVTGGNTNNACKDKVVLKSGSKNSCDLACGKGFSGRPGKLTCSVRGGAARSSMECIGDSVNTCTDGDGPFCPRDAVSLMASTGTCEGTFLSELAGWVRKIDGSDQPLSVYCCRTCLAQPKSPARGSGSPKGSSCAGLHTILEQVSKTMAELELRLNNRPCVAPRVSDERTGHCGVPGCTSSHYEEFNSTATTDFGCTLCDANTTAYKRQFCCCNVLSCAANGKCVQKGSTPIYVPSNGTKFRHQDLANRANTPNGFDGRTKPIHLRDLTYPGVVPSECVDDRYDQLTSMTNYTDTCETLPRLMSRIGDAWDSPPDGPDDHAFGCHSTMGDLLWHMHKRAGRNPYNVNGVFKPVTYTYGLPLVLAVKGGVSFGGVKTVSYDLFYQTNKEAHNVHAMYGGGALGLMRFPPAYNYKEVQGSGRGTQCSSVWLGACKELGGMINSNAVRASYISLGGVGADVKAMNIDGAKWSSKAQLKVTNGAVYWADSSKGCVGKCQVARITIPAADSRKWEAWANVQGHVTGHFDKKTGVSSISKQHWQTPSDMLKATGWAERVRFAGADEGPWKIKSGTETDLTRKVKDVCRVSCNNCNNVPLTIKPPNAAAVRSKPKN